MEQKVHCTFSSPPPTPFLFNVFHLRRVPVACFVQTRSHGSVWWGSHENLWTNKKKKVNNLQCWKLLIITIKRLCSVESPILNLHSSCPTGSSFRLTGRCSGICVFVQPWLWKHWGSSYPKGLNWKAWARSRPGSMSDLPRSMWKN